MSVILPRLVVGVALTLITMSAVAEPIAAECQTMPSTPWHLSALLARVANCNHEVIAAKDAYMAAQADEQIASQRPNPTLTVGVAGINPQKGIGGSLLDKTVDSSIRIDQLIERGDKASLREAVAGANSQAAARDLDDTIRQQQAAVIAAWYDALAAHQRLAILQELQSLYQQTEQLATHRVAVGDLPANDLARIRLDTSRAASDVVLATSDYQLAVQELARLVGSAGQKEAIELAGDWPNNQHDIPTLTDDIWEKRPDLAAIKARLAAADAGRRLARAQAVADVSIGVQADHYPTSPSNSVGTGNSYAVSLSIPLALRHHHQGEVRRGEADYNAAESAYMSARFMAQADSQHIQNQLFAARDRLNLLQQKLIPESEKIASNLQQAYNKGAASVIDLLDSRRALRQLSLDGLAAQVDYAKLLANWYSTLALPISDLASDTVQESH